jgi:hypothetical protein
MRTTTLTLALPATLWAALLGLALACPAHAQWTNDPYRGMVSVCNDTAYQDWAQTCELGGGNTLFAWMDHRNGLYQIYYQVLNGAGLPLLEGNGLPLFEANWGYGWGSTTMKNLFSDGEGGAVLAIVDLRDSLPDLYGQRVDAQGNRLWGPTGLPLVLWPGSEAVAIANKDIVADSMGNVFIAWAPAVVGDTTQLFVQKLDAAGQLPWGLYGVPICQIVPSQQMAGIVSQLVPDGGGDHGHLGRLPLELVHSLSLSSASG